jgi:hypothetical protein
MCNLRRGSGGDLAAALLRQENRQRGASGLLPQLLGAGRDLRLPGEEARTNVSNVDLRMAGRGRKQQAYS